MLMSHDVCHMTTVALQDDKQTNVENIKAVYSSCSCLWKRTVTLTQSVKHLHHRSIQAGGIKILAVLRHYDCANAWNYTEHALHNSV